MSSNTLCGWSGLEIRVENNTAILNRMLSAASASIYPSTPHGLTVATGSFEKFGSIFHNENITVTLEGRISWKDSKLQSLSQQHSHAHALASGFRQLGNAVLKLIRGAFSCTIIDHASNSTTLAIDKMGINSMCYALINNGIVFGGSAEQVAAHPSVRREIDPQSIYHYLFFHMVPAPVTTFRGIKKLLPGELIHFKDGEAKQEFYWHMPYQDDGHESFNSYATQFKKTLRQAVKRNAEEATGAFLSGGTDSSTITGMLTQVLGEPADTYSIGFDAEGYDEMEYARIASRHFQTSPHEYYVTPDDVVNIIPRIATAYDAPFGNASAVPTYYCAKLAYECGTRVLLAGDGGDELFGGNARYAKQKVFELYSHTPSPIRRNILEPLLLNLPGVDKIPIIRKIQSYINQARIPLPDRLESYNFLYRDPLESILESEFLNSIQRERPEELMREIYQRTASASVLNRMMHLDLKQTLADNDLPKVSQMCALAGIEVRYPMLDDDLVEFSARLPPSLKVKGQALRYFFKEALKDYLPADIINKTKHGFGLPFGLWMKDHKKLRELSYDSLSALGKRGYVKSSYIDDVLDRHRSGYADYYGVMVWVLMMLEQWLEAHQSG